jgi:hypothetical protein
MVVHACNPNYAGSISKRITEQGQAWAKMWNPIWKIPKAKRAGGVVWVVECLLSKPLIQDLVPPKQKW